LCCNTSIDWTLIIQDYHVHLQCLNLRYEREASSQKEPNKAAQLSVKIVPASRAGLKTRRLETTNIYHVVPCRILSVSKHVSLTYSYLQIIPYIVNGDKFFSHKVNKTTKNINLHSTEYIIWLWKVVHSYTGWKQTSGAPSGPKQTTI